MDRISEIRKRCPMQNFVRAISGKWKLMILESLLPDGSIRYSRFQDIIPEINGRGLTRALQDLERDGLICRNCREERLHHVEYCLSPLGKKAVLALMQIRETAAQLNGADLSVCEECLIYEYADSLEADTAES